MHRRYDEYFSSMIRILLLISIGDDKRMYNFMYEILEDENTLLYLLEDACKHIQEHDSLYKHALYAGLVGNLGRITSCYYKKYQKLMLFNDFEMDISTSLGNDMLLNGKRKDHDRKSCSESSGK